MKLEEIKSKYSMLDILARYNIRVTRGFCQCPFHKADRTPSMKVYKDGFYCFGCGAGGDFIKFVQLHDNLSFEEACKFISGEELETKTRFQLALNRVVKKRETYKKEKLQKQLKEVTNKLAPLWQKHLNSAPVFDSEPFPDEWCDSYNEWQKLVYQQETLIKELGEI